MPQQRPARRLLQRVEPGRVEHVGVGRAAPREFGVEHARLARGGGIEQGGAARQCARGVRPARCEPRHHLQPQVVAFEARVGVGWILDPSQPLGLRPRADRVARQSQPRARQPTGGERPQRAHSTQALGAGGAQQAQQQGLGLVIGVVGGDQDLASVQGIGEGRVARRARGGFQPASAARLDLHALHLQRDAERGGLRAHRGRPAGTVGMQAVVDVDRGQAARARRRLGRQRVQQCGGVEPAAGRHP